MHGLSGNLHGLSGRGVRRVAHRPRRTPRLHVKLTAVYTEQDACLKVSVYVPRVIDIHNMLLGEDPQPDQLRQVQQGCTQTGFLALTGHGIPPEQLERLFAAARSFFDLPRDEKRAHVVGGMLRGRGYEISPEHKAYMSSWQQLDPRVPHGSYQQEPYTQPAAQALLRADPAAAPAPKSQRPTLAGEPSSLEGILSERFCCGPPLSPSQLQKPYYTCELGQVFFTPDSWPAAAAPQLQPAMQETFVALAAVADAVMRLFAASLGLPVDFFNDKINKPCSNMQVANYPSQLDPLPGPQDLRKKAHLDSGTLTLLASDDWLEGSSWQPGEGGLQLMNSLGEWVEVAVPPGTLLMNLGSVLTHWTNGLWKSTLHRVVNPPARKAGSTRRVSVAFFHKPNYDARVEVLPTCCCAGGTAAQGATSETTGGHDVDGRRSSSSEQQQQPPWADAPLVPARFEPVLAAELTRAGILHKYRHLPPEEASRRYHQQLAAIRSAAA